MRFFNKVSLIVGAIALTAAPVVASAAQSAQKLSVANYSQARVDAQISDENDLRGGFLIPAIALVAIIAGIIIASDGSSNKPTSP